MKKQWIKFSLLSIIMVGYFYLNSTLVVQADYWGYDNTANAQAPWRDTTYTLTNPYPNGKPTRRLLTKSVYKYQVWGTYEDGLETDGWMTTTCKDHNCCQNSRPTYIINGGYSGCWISSWEELAGTKYRCVCSRPKYTDGWGYNGVLGNQSGWVDSVPNGANKVATGTYHSYQNYYDDTKPSMSCSVQNVTKTSYQIKCTNASDNYSGVRDVRFPTRHNDGSFPQGTANWPVGTQQSDGSWLYTVNTSQFGNASGVYHTHAYVFDNAGNSYGIGFEVNLSYGSYAGGTGTKDDPYLITTPEELDYLRYQVNIEKVNTAGKYYALGNDIDMSSFDSDDDVSNGNFKPIGYWESDTEYNYFKGHFLGNGYSISNLKIILPQQVNVGLFGRTDSANITQVGLENVYIKADSHIGGLVGWNNQTIIQQSYVKGMIVGTKGSIGGLVGYQVYGTITDVYTQVTIQTTNLDNPYIGGLIGINRGGTLTNGLSLGNINSTSTFKGALVGSNHTGGTITNAYWDSNQFPNFDADGENGATITNSMGLPTVNLQKHQAIDSLPTFDFDTIWNVTNNYPKFQYEEVTDFLLQSSLTNNLQEVQLEWVVIRNRTYEIFRAINDSTTFTSLESNLTTKKYLDTQALDLISPSKPIILSETLGTDDRIQIQLDTATDTGTTYHYYVEASLYSAKMTSNTVSETIISEVAGYSYVVDKKSDTIPDKTVDSTSTLLKINHNNDVDLILHVRTIDNAGNASETIHYPLKDVINVKVPTLTLTRVSQGIRADWTLPVTNLSDYRSNLYQGNKLIVDSESVLSFVDTSVKDTVAPMTPILSAYYNDQHQLVFDYQSTDYGSLYTYQVESVNSYDRVSDKTPKQEVEFISGLKHYTVIVDNDIQNAITTQAETHVTKAIGNVTLEVSAHDNDGNVSTVSSLRLFGLAAQNVPNLKLNRLTWESVTNSTYQIYRRDDTNGQFKALLVNPTTKLTFDDTDAIDVGKPTIPRVMYEILTPDEMIEVSFGTPYDTGTTYEYYISSLNTITGTTSVSNTVSVILESEVAGYSYVMDQNPNTIPDDTIDFGKTASDDTITLNPNGKTNLYLHIKTLDTSGNASETLHYRLKDAANGVIPTITSLTESDSGVEILWSLPSPDGDGFGSRLYRDTTLIMDTAVTTKYVDTQAVDKAKPNTPQPKLNYNANQQFMLSWDKVSDNGTTYSYEVSSVNDYNQVSPRSTAKTITVNSGVDYYEIYLDNTFFDSTLSLQYTFPTHVIGLHQFKVVAVDKHGNRTASQTISSFNVSSTISNNVIQLTWDDLGGRHYQIYRREGNETSFKKVLSSLTSAIRLSDNVATDKVAPSQPAIHSHTDMGNGTVVISLASASDSGTDYEYYVESYTGGQPEFVSNLVNETIVSGVKGYSYVLDKNPNTVPDTTMDVGHVQSLTLNTNNQVGLFLHIRTLDHAGNVSNTVHYSLGSGYAKGSGTQADPYLISNPTELDYLRYEVNVLQVNTQGVYYKLVADINMSGFDNDGNANNGNFIPIGTSESVSFKGFFDGNRHVISNLVIKNGINQFNGLFGSVTDGQVHHLRLENATIQGRDFTGGLIGHLSNAHVYENYFQGNVTGTDYTGGLVGRQMSGTIENTRVHATVNGNQYVGGLIGGQLNGRMDTSYAVGKASGYYAVGGVVGHRASVASISNSYFDQTVAQTTTSVGEGSSTGTKALTTANITGTNVRSQMAGFNFNSIWRVLSDYPKLRWEPYDATDAPPGYSGGSGTQNDPYLISNAFELDYLRYQVNIEKIDTTNKYYRVINDIEMIDFDSDTNEQNGNFIPIGFNGTTFKGHFDGDGHLIKDLNLQFNSNQCVGLFGQTNGGSVTKVGFKDLSVVGGDYTGSLIGCATNTQVDQIWVRGTVQGLNDVGGTVGKIANAHLTNVLMEATVKGSSRIGGLIGTATNVQIRTSLTVGSVSGWPIVAQMDNNSLIAYAYWDKNKINQSSATPSGRMIRSIGWSTNQLITDWAYDYLVTFDFKNTWHNTISYPMLHIFCENDVEMGEYGPSVTTLYIHVFDNEVGLQSAYYKWSRDGAVIQAKQNFAPHARIMLSCADTGVNSFYVEAIDKLGNKRTESRDVTVRCDNPITIDSPKESIWLSIDWDESDETS